MREDYLKGVTPTLIAEKYGLSKTQVTVACARQGWNAAKKSVKKAVERQILRKSDSHISKATRSLAESIVHQRKRFTDMLQRDALRKVEFYTEQMPDPENWKDAANSERALSSVSARGRIALGLDDTQSHLHLHFGVPSQSQSDTPQLTESTQVIDVDTVKPD